jgi:hypothetical protein
MLLIEPKFKPSAGESMPYDPLENLWDILKNTNPSTSLQALSALAAYQGKILVHEWGSKDCGCLLVVAASGIKPPLSEVPRNKTAVAEILGWEERDVKHALYIWMGEMNSRTRWKFLRDVRLYVRAQTTHCPS